MRLEMKIINQEALDGLRLAPRRINRRCRRVNEVFAPIVVDTAKQFATGRPGPNIITGAFYRSIHVIGTWAMGFAFGSDEPQAERLEYGFIGRDSMGREYNQPPYPSMRPALWYWRGPWKRAMLQAAKGGVFRAR